MNIDLYKKYRRVGENKENVYYYLNLQTILSIYRQQDGYSLQNGRLLSLDSEKAVYSIDLYRFNQPVYTGYISVATAADEEIPGETRNKANIAMDRAISGILSRFVPECQLPLELAFPEEDLDASISAVSTDELDADNLDFTEEEASVEKEVKDVEKPKNTEIEKDLKAKETLEEYVETTETSEVKEEDTKEDDSSPFFEINEQEEPFLAQLLNNKQDVLNDLSNNGVKWETSLLRKE